MPTTITKPTAPKSKLITAAELKAAVIPDTKAPTEMTDAELADHLGAVTAQIDELIGPLKDREKALASEARARAKTVESKKPYTMAGSKWRVVFSPARQVRKITDVASVLLTLGEEAFLEICSVSVSDLDKVLSVDEQKSKGLIEYNDGSRTMKIEGQ